MNATMSSISVWASKSTTWEKHDAFVTKLQQEINAELPLAHTEVLWCCYILTARQ